MSDQGTSWRNRITGLRYVQASELASNPENWRKHPDSQRRALETVLDEVGWVGAALFNTRTQRLIDGHLRKELAPEAMIPVLDVDLSEEEEQIILISLDPIGAMAKTSQADLQKLLEALDGKNTAIDQMLNELAKQDRMAWRAAKRQFNNPDAALERANELVEKWKIERGQIWQVGRHRIMCGDSYDKKHVAALLADKQPDLLHTDPPYGISIVGKKTGAIGKGNNYVPVEGDDRPFDPSSFLDMAPIVVLWGANYYADKLPVRAGWIIWDKREGTARNHFSDCELAWTNQDSPARLFHHLWNGMVKGSQTDEKRTHPTEKPIALFEEIGQFLARKGLWLDLFAGTGAQVLAAERSGATCYANEWEPHYVAVILERLVDVGLEPELVESSL